MNDIAIILPVSKKVKYLTISVFVLWMIAAAFIYIKSTGSFLPAMFILLSISIFLMVWIGIPKKIILSEERLTIVCVLRLVTINKSDIISARSVDSSSFRIFGTSGFIGYIGIFYLKKQKCFAEAFARSWDNLILIQAKNNKNYVIGVDDKEKMITLLREYGISA